MFLPVLLMRELGVWGWIVFAVPNVIGAAAMGWVLKSPQSSRQIVQNHAAACRAFSIVTIAFHVFFVLWFVPRLIGLPVAGTAFALVFIYLLLTITRPGVDLFAAAITLLISVALLVVFVTRTHVAIDISGARPAIGALWLAPACIFGFSLCPYLDLTFHRARLDQSTDASSRLVFTTGFCIWFLAMVVFSLMYSKFLAPLLLADWREHVRPVLSWIVAIHMIVQTAFTMAIHARSLAASKLTAGGGFALLLLTQLALVAGLAGNLPGRIHGLDPGELIYRLFMSFYGLVFPAYVWVCMVPKGRGGPIGLMLGISIAAPMFWMGFIEGQMIWLVPAVAVALLSRYLPITSAT